MTIKAAAKGVGVRLPLIHTLIHVLMHVLIHVMIHVLIPPSDGERGEGEAVS